MRSSSFFFGINLPRHKVSAPPARPAQSAELYSPAVQHRHTAREHRDLEAVLLLKVLHELLERQVALDEEAAADRVSGKLDANRRTGTRAHRSQSVNSVSRYCSASSDQPEVSGARTHRLTFIFGAAIGLEKAKSGSAKLIKALWYCSISVLPSMSCGGGKTQHQFRSAGSGAILVTHLVQLEIDQRCDAGGRRGKSRNDLASDTLRRVAVCRLDAVVERTAVR